jgi:hypothetical protein
VGSAARDPDYASLLPETVIAEMLSAPVTMRRQFLHWGAGAALALDTGLPYRDFRRAERDVLALQRWMVGHFDGIRRSPGDVGVPAPGWPGWRVRSGRARCSSGSRTSRSPHLRTAARPACCGVSTPCR